MFSRALRRAVPLCRTCIRPLSSRVTSNGVKKVVLSVTAITGMSSAAAAMSTIHADAKQPQQQTEAITERWTETKHPRYIMVDVDGKPEKLILVGAGVRCIPPDKNLHPIAWTGSFALYVRASDLAALVGSDFSDVMSNPEVMKHISIVLTRTWDSARLHKDLFHEFHSASTPRLQEMFCATPVLVKGTTIGMSFVPGRDVVVQLGNASVAIPDEISKMALANMVFGTPKPLVHKNNAEFVSVPENLLKK